jgi:hypothetical protein
VALSEEILDLGEKLECLAAKEEVKVVCSRRDEVYQQKRQLMSDELKKWQKLQPRKITDEKASVLS